MLRVLDVKRIIISIITRIRRTLTMTPGLFTQVGTKTTQLKSRKKYSNVVYYLNINNKRITRHKEFRNLKEKKKDRVYSNEYYVVFCEKSLCSIQLIHRI